ncbi:unnamed protein product, partial [Adineta steineri]
WKVDGEITKLESQLSDRRIFEIVNVVRSMPLPQIKSNDEVNIAVSCIISRQMKFLYYF